MGTITLMDEYEVIRQKYSHCAVFNNDDSSKRDKNHVVVLMETWQIYPDNYNVEELRKYKAVLTYNKKFYNMRKNDFSMYLLNGYPCFNRGYCLSEFKKFEEKINGVCLMSRYRKDVRDGSIAEKRLAVLDNLRKSGYPNTHCFGSFPYGVDMYRGIVGKKGTSETFPSSLEKLKKLNEYRFNIAFENVYHPLWSNGYVTEKMLDCFRSKTVPIYLGAYNIEELIPVDLFIDYRKFKSDSELASYLASMSKNQYEDMTEKAFEWDRTSRLGNVEDVCKLIEDLSK